MNHHRVNYVDLQSISRVTGLSEADIIKVADNDIGVRNSIDYIRSFEGKKVRIIRARCMPMLFQLLNISRMGEHMAEAKRAVLKALEGAEPEIGGDYVG
ncbi:hypothetical protein NSQ90_00495 [Paenibacillus sp. FSL H7-0737]|uniref:hypothetical protein n=1 Tax=Paenibacillus sp. FSL H7-0737 TaxID=1536775 RepID=UPI0012DFEF2C